MGQAQTVEKEVLSFRTQNSNLGTGEKLKGVLNNFYGKDDPFNEKIALLVGSCLPKNISSKGLKDARGKIIGK